MRHLAPEPWPGRNGKVAGVVTGVRRARHERVVLADDDVRYDDASLRAVVAGLDEGELVRPQNVFTSWPWHARWDTGRSLLNRAVSHDHPGTFGVRRSCFVAMGGYDGDVLFENLELTRTVASFGGRVVDLPGVFVGRVPPDAGHFWSQRVRQAYDDLAQPPRLLLELSVLPLALLGLFVRRPGTVLAGALAAVLVAEAGRRRAGGASAYPRSAACVGAAVAGGAVGLHLARAGAGAPGRRAVRRWARPQGGHPVAGCGPGPGGRSRGTATAQALTGSVSPQPSASSRRRRRTARTALSRRDTCIWLMPSWAPMSACVRSSMKRRCNNRRSAGGSPATTARSEATASTRSMSSQGWGAGRRGNGSNGIDAPRPPRVVRVGVVLCVLGRTATWSGQRRA